MRGLRRRPSEGEFNFTPGHYTETDADDYEDHADEAQTAYESWLDREC